MLTFKQLTTPVTEEQATATLISWLSGLGFGSTSWQSGSTQLTFVMLSAKMFSHLTEMVATLAKAGFSATAEGEWLTRKAASDFDNQRMPAVAARHRMQFTCASSAGPYTPTVGKIVVSDAERTYRLVQDADYPIVTIPRGGSVYMVVEAEVPGEAGNATVGTINRMVTTYAGVTCSNPGINGGTSRLVDGDDEEDDARLHLRNCTKWANLSIEVTIDGVINAVLNATSYVKKVYVDDTNPRGAGTVDVYVFGSNTISSTPLALVQAALDKRFIGNTKEDGTKRALAIAASAYVLTTGGTIYVAPGKTETARLAVEAALTDLITALPIGGDDYTPGPSHVVARNDIIAAIEGAEGVRACVLTTPAANLTIPTTKGVVAPASWGFTYTETLK